MRNKNRTRLLVLLGVTFALLVVGGVLLVRSNENLAGDVPRGYSRESVASECVTSNKCPATDCGTRDSSCFCIQHCPGGNTLYWDCAMQPQEPQCPP